MLINFLLGPHGGTPKCPCFICLWYSRAKDRHWDQKEWPVRTRLTVGEKNVINEPLVDHEKKFSSSSYQARSNETFVKALDTDGECFKYLCEAFPGVIY